MIRDNTDCPYLHDIFDQYCNLFKGYKNCGKNDCEVLKILKENEQLEQQIEKMKCCENCNNQRKNKRLPLSKRCFECKNRSHWELAE